MDGGWPSDHLWNITKILYMEHYSRACTSTWECILGVRGILNLLNIDIHQCYWPWAFLSHFVMMCSRVEMTWWSVGEWVEEHSWWHKSASLDLVCKSWPVRMQRVMRHTLRILAQRFTWSQCLSVSWNVLHMIFLAGVPLHWMVVIRPNWRSAMVTNALMVFKLILINELMKCAWNGLTFLSQ